MFLFDRNLPDEVIDELAWGSEAILTSTAAAAILIHNDGVNILRRGITSSNDFKPVRNLSEIYKRYETNIIG